MKENSKFTQQLIKELAVKDEKTLLKTLEKVKTKGTDEIIKPMLALYSETSFTEVKIAIKGILDELKSEKGIIHLINELKNNDLELQEVILGALWSAGLNPIQYIPEIVTCACNGNYMIAFEVITILENMEGPFDEEKLTESRLILNDYFANPDKEKEQLIKTILGLINEMDASLEA